MLQRATIQILLIFFGVSVGQIQPFAHGKIPQQKIWPTDHMGDETYSPVVCEVPYR